MSVQEDPEDWATSSNGTMTPSEMTLSSMAAMLTDPSPVQRKDGWTQFALVREAAKQWSFFDAKITAATPRLHGFSPAYVSPAELKREMSMYTMMRDRWEAEFKQRHADLPECSQLPSIKPDFIKILGGKWMTQSRQDSEPEGMSRGLGWLSVRERLGGLMDVFKDITALTMAQSDFDADVTAIKEKHKAEIEQLHKKLRAAVPNKVLWPFGESSRTWTDQEIPNRSAALDSLPQVWNSVTNISLTGLDEGRDASLQLLESHMDALLKTATRWADSLGLEMRMTPELAVATWECSSKSSVETPAKPMTDLEREEGSILQACGLSDERKRDPDLTNDPIRLAWWAHGQKSDFRSFASPNWTSALAVASA